ncbi:hypothetical protein L1887_31696 [Cichorium endivia]|nr:hypothetical protein L1887_31696 [Cichorium endivia]
MSDLGVLWLDQAIPHVCTDLALSSSFSSLVPSSICFTGLHRWCFTDQLESGGLHGEIRQPWVRIQGDERERYEGLGFFFGSPLVVQDVVDGLQEEGEGVKRLVLAGVIGEEGSPARDRKDISKWIDALLCNLNENVGWKFALCSMENKICDVVLHDFRLSSGSALILQLSSLASTSSSGSALLEESCINTATELIGDSVIDSADTRTNLSRLPKEGLRPAALAPADNPDRIPVRAGFARVRTRLGLSVSKQMKTKEKPCLYMEL